MPAADLANTDAVVACVTWLSTYPRVLATVDGDPSRVGGANRPPYPRLRVLGAPGDDRDLRWLLAPRVQVEALGDPDGTPGPVVLRQMLYIALGALTEMPDAPAVPGQPVVTAVLAAAGGGWVPLPNGQGRQVSVISVYLHPPPG